MSDLLAGVYANGWDGEEFHESNNYEVPAKRPGQFVRIKFGISSYR